MKSRIVHLFCESIFKVALSSLYSPLWKVEDTLKDISDGRVSMNSGVVKVSKLGNGRYFIIDGNHRVVEAIQRGEVSINVTLDEYIPDMNKTGGAYDTMVKSAIRVVEVVKSSLEEAPMYHGTNVKFDKPKDGIIHWVTTSKEFATEYSKGAVVHRGGGEPIVYEHDIDVKHPALVEDDYISITKLLSKWYESRPNKNVEKELVLKKMNDIREMWHVIGLDNSTTATHNHWNMTKESGNRLLIDFLELLGYDGIYYKEFGNDTYGIWKGF
jgi:hypothetical protein